MNHLHTIQSKKPIFEWNFQFSITVWHRPRSLRSSHATFEDKQFHARILHAFPMLPCFYRLLWDLGIGFEVINKDLQKYLCTEIQQLVNIYFLLRYINFYKYENQPRFSRIISYF